MDKTGCIAAVQADARLVKNIETPDQRRPQRCGEIDALTLTTGECIALSVEREIAKPDIAKEGQTRLYLGEQALADLPFMVGKLKMVEPVLEILHRHLHQIHNAATAYLHPCGFLAQAGAVTRRTNRLATIATHHHTILDLILVFLHHVEETVNADSISLALSVFLFVARQPVPQHILFTL